MNKKKYSSYVMNGLIKFSHCWLNYDPLSISNRFGRTPSIMQQRSIDEMNVYVEGDCKNRVQMSTYEQRLCKEIEDPYKYWNGCVWVDIDYKDVPNSNEKDWDNISYFVKDNILYNFQDNFYYYETSRSKKGGHFIFYYECERNEENFKKYSSISRKIVYDAFVNEGYKNIIDYKGVYDSCCKSIFQCVYITKINYMFNEGCTGKITDNYPEITKEIKRITFNKPSDYIFENNSYSEPKNIEYINHTQRWQLFISLSRLFKGEDLKREWIKCSNMIPEKNGHTRKYYNECPYINDWNDKLKGDEYCDVRLLKMFGYDVNISQNNMSKDEALEILINFLNK